MARPERQSPLTRARRLAPVVVVAVALVAAACSSGDDEASEAPTTTASPPAPTDAAAPPSWAPIAPADAGFDPAALDALLADAEAAGSACVVVVRDGRVVVDEAWPAPTEPREVFSITKSLTSVLVGIAAEQGHLAFDDPVSRYVPEWQGTPSEAVTIEHLLAGVSGRHWDLATDYGQMALREPDKTDFAISLDQTDPPGTVWAYNNAAVQVLSRVLEAATGVDASTFAAQELFAPLGMERSELTRDPAGNPLTFMGLRSTCSDVARLGQLLLEGGRWGAERLLPDAYLEAATQPATELNAAYGWLWWVNGEGPIAGPTLATTGRPEAGPQPQGPLVSAAPSDAFWALGLHDQVLAVLPSEGIVAVRLGSAPPPEAPFGVAQLTEGVLDAVAR